MTSNHLDTLFKKSAITLTLEYSQISLVFSVNKPAAAFLASFHAPVFQSPVHENTKQPSRPLGPCSCHSLVQMPSHLHLS